MCAVLQMLLYHAFSTKLLPERNHQLLSVSPSMRDFEYYLTFILAPSMFGRELIEQVEADSKGEERQVPVIVEKCIDAVEARGTLLI
jgi:hypothetical protein